MSVQILFLLYLHIVIALFQVLNNQQYCCFTYLVLFKMESQKYLRNKCARKNINTRRINTAVQAYPQWICHLKMSKYVGEKNGKLCISNTLSSKGALTQNDNTQTWNVIHINKVLYQILAQNIKACRKKVWKTVLPKF